MLHNSFFEGVLAKPTLMSEGNIKMDITETGRDNTESFHFLRGQLQVMSCCEHGNELPDLLNDSKGFSSNELAFHSLC